LHTELLSNRAAIDAALAKLGVALTLTKKDETRAVPPMPAVMATARLERRLTAILAADVAGYSRLTSMDEEVTHVQLKEHLRIVVDPKINEHRGHVVKNTGDGMLAEFSSVVDALRCAVDVQRGMAERNAGVPQERRIEFRIGINVGDIIADTGDIFGDSVNVAVRLEGIAEPGGICVSGRVQEYAQGHLNVTFEDAGEQKLKNIVRPVRAYRVRLDNRANEARHALTLPDKPSIAVLPFQNMSGDAEQEYFADGIAEDIITMLSRSPSLFVIARNSSFTFKGRAVDVKQVARELGVRYVLEGSVRCSGNRVRVTGQLVEAESGNHLWAERYDRDLSDVFAVQDEITEAIAIAIIPRVAETERYRTVRKPPERLDAWEAYQRGRWHMGRPSAVDLEAAKTFFRRAIELDPNFAAAHASLAAAILTGVNVYQMPTLFEGLGEAIPAAKTAISLDPRDAVARGCIGFILILQGQLDSALAEAEQALSSTPNDPGAYHLLGATLIFLGQPKEGLGALRAAVRLDPHDPLMGLRSYHIACAHFLLREYEACAKAVRETIRTYPDHPLAHRLLAAALGEMGSVDEAKQELLKAIEIAPKSFDMYVRHRVPWMRPEDHEHMLDGLRKAGWTT
jgi:adenylate cyclase